LAIQAAAITTGDQSQYDPRGIDGESHRFLALRSNAADYNADFDRMTKDTPFTRPCPVSIAKRVSMETATPTQVAKKCVAGTFKPQRLVSALSTCHFGTSRDRGTWTKGVNLIPFIT
jgi:hypothetical protein